MADTVLTGVTSPFLAPSSCDNELQGHSVRPAVMSTERMTDNARSGVVPDRDRERVLVPSRRPHGIRHGTEKTCPFREFTGKPRLSSGPSLRLRIRSRLSGSRREKGVVEGCGTR